MHFVSDQEMAVMVASRCQCLSLLHLPPPVCKVHEFPMFSAGIAVLPVLQAKALGDVLVVGLIPDSEILRCKGPPVLNEEERLLLVDNVKWVDEVITGGETEAAAHTCGYQLTATDSSGSPHMWPPADSNR